MSRFGEGATVRYAIPEDYWNPDAGGGPIRRSSGVAVRQAPGTGDYVRRTPHAAVWDAESGGAYEPQLWQDQFLPDGRIVRAGTAARAIDAESGMAGFGGTFGTWFMPATERQWALRAGFASSVAFGAILGGSLRTDGRLKGVGLGAVLGAIGGIALLSCSLVASSKAA